MSEPGMVERVARAIYESFPLQSMEGRVQWAELPEQDPYRGYFITWARAAIAELRQPTTSMIKAAWVSDWVSENPATVWREMIDDALMDPPPPRSGSS